MTPTQSLLRRLYEASIKVWHDNADETPGHISDPWVWADWIDAIEATTAHYAGDELPEGECNHTDPCTCDTWRT